MVGMESKKKRIVLIAALAVLLIVGTMFAVIRSKSSPKSMPPAAETPAPTAVVTPEPSPEATATPEPTVVPTATPAPTATPEPTPEPTPTPTPVLVYGPSEVTFPEEDPNLVSKDEAFSVIWLADTQAWVTKGSFAPKIPEVFGWIADTREELNTVAVVHTGDVVENGGNPVHWERINAGIAKLPQDLPFIVSAGNQDAGKKTLADGLWFSQDFVKNADPAKTYRNGEGFWQTVEAGNTKLLFVALAYEAMDDAGFAWMRGVMNDHPDHTGIVLAHSILSYNHKGRSLYTKMGERIVAEIAAQCDNVRLMLCGHITGMTRHRETFPHPNGGTRCVEILRYNYQDFTAPKNMGFLRILRFDPAENTLEVFTYSPLTGRTHLSPTYRNEEHLLITEIFPEPEA
ncbi:MAG: metallophosphoesterase [Clostridia bacterium]|nr:metallophosphoesterase [Clostridia bacterium]